ETASFLRDERIVGRSSSRDGGKDQTRNGNGRQVLQTMHGEVGAAVADRLLNRLGEQPVAADLRQGFILDLIALGLDDDQLDLSSRRHSAQKIRNVVGLPERERAAAGADSQGPGHLLLPEMDAATYRAGRVQW